MGRTLASFAAWVKQEQTVTIPAQGLRQVDFRWDISK
jgi:hypothetical protein